jgi:hypothetical protein
MERDGEPFAEPDAIALKQQVEHWAASGRTISGAGASFLSW